MNEKQMKVELDQLEASIVDKPSNKNTLIRLLQKIKQIIYRNHGAPADAVRLWRRLDSEDRRLLKSFNKDMVEGIEAAEKDFANFFLHIKKILSELDPDLCIQHTEAGWWISESLTKEEQACFMKHALDQFRMFMGVE